MQITAASLRGNLTVMSKMVDNEPLSLMKWEEILDQYLKRAKVTNDELQKSLKVIAQISPDFEKISDIFSAYIQTHSLIKRPVIYVTL